MYVYMSIIYSYCHIPDTAYHNQQPYSAYIFVGHQKGIWILQDID